MRPGESASEEVDADGEVIAFLHEIHHAVLKGDIDDHLRVAAAVLSKVLWKPLPAGDQLGQLIRNVPRGVLFNDPSSAPYPPGRPGLSCSVRNRPARAQ